MSEAARSEHSGPDGCPELMVAVKTVRIALEDGVGPRALSEALEEARRLVDAHIGRTEAPEGMLEQIAADSPRLIGTIQRVRIEHAEMRLGLDEALRRSGDDQREAAVALAERFEHHQRTGNDLFWHAYQLDLGGGEG